MSRLVQWPELQKVKVGRGWQRVCVISKLLLVISFFYWCRCCLSCCFYLSQCESKKSSPPKTFYNIFTQVKYISVKFCQYVASLYLHIFTTFGRFVLIFKKMTSIFLRVPIVFNVSSFTFHQVKSLWLRRQIMSGLQMHPTSVLWIIRLGGNTRVLLQTATEAKNSSQVYRCTLADLVCIARESHWQCCERQPQLTSGMCVSHRWNFEHVMWQFV